MAYKKKNKIIKKILIISMMILTVLLIFSDLGVMKYLQLKQNNTQLTKKIKDHDNEIVLLEKESTKLKNDTAYIEKIAREEFGMAKKGEKIFLVKNKSKKGEN